MLIVLTAIAGIGRRSNTPHIGVYLMATSNGGYYIYTAKPSWVLIPSYYLRVHIWMGGSLGPSE